MNFTKKSLLKFTSLAFGLIAATNVSAVTITYIHNDAAGTPLVATDASGNLLWKENYRPYGDRLNNQPASSNNSLWYSGKPYDSQTGLTYMGARYYDTVLGRFTGVDPHGFDPDNIQSFNRYAYANNNPYKFVDPNGKYAVWALEVDYTLFFGIASRVGGAALGVAIGSLGFDILHPHAFEPLQSRGGLLPQVPTGAGQVPPADRDPKRFYDDKDKIEGLKLSGGKCDNGCGTDIDLGNSAGHHKKRHADGGKTDDENRAMVCIPCHKWLHRGRGPDGEDYVPDDIDHRTPSDGGGGVEAPEPTDKSPDAAP